MQLSQHDVGVHRAVHADLFLIVVVFLQVIIHFLLAQGVLGQLIATGQYAGEQQGGCAHQIFFINASLRLLAKSAADN